jgi:orotate phosphoribosyltransferase
MNEEEIMNHLRESGAFLEGHFLLSSGLHSPAYVQCAQLLQYPGRAGLVCADLAELWKDERPDVVVGPALGGILVAYELARALGARALFTERENGAMTFRRGFTLEPGEKVLLSEDIVTTGKSAKESIEVVRSMGAKVIGVAAIGNRNQGNPFDVPFRALVNLSFPTYKAEECPLCAEGGAPVKPGSRTMVKD